MAVKSPAAVVTKASEMPGDGAQAGGTRRAQAGKGVNDAPNSPEQADERSDRTGGGQPGHAFFHAANFFGRGQLHVDGNCAYAFKCRRMWITGSRADLALQFAITGGVNVGERRTCGRKRLRIGHTARSPKNAQELVALPVDAAEQAEFLQNHSPRDDGKKEKQCQ